MRNENYYAFKEARLERKNRIKILQNTINSLNMQLKFSQPDEEEKINLIGQLRAMEITLMKVKRNVNLSNAYELKEGPIYNRFQRKDYDNIRNYKYGIFNYINYE